ARRHAVARARADRHLQPLVLRGGPGRAGASRPARAPEAARGAGDAAHLATAFRGYLRVRAHARPQRHAGAEVLPAHFERGAAPALSRAPPGAVEAMEVLDGRRQRAQAVG